MNKCVIELRGEVKNIIRFLIENVKFAYADNDGIHFTTDIQFGNIVKEMDNDAMKEIYGVPVSIPVKYMDVEITKCEPEYGDGYYIDEENDDKRPRDLYKFKIRNNSYEDDRVYFSIEKTFINGTYYKPYTYAEDKRQFMEEFFNEFSNLQYYCKADVNKLKDWAYLKFEVSVYDIPIEITEAWRQEYEVCTDVIYVDEEKIVKYYRYHIDDGEVNLNEIRPDDDKILQYTELLLENNWANIHLMVGNICDMLYDMKDKLPFDIDLEKNEHGRFKYDKSFANISNTVYSLNRNNKKELAKLYVMIGKTFDKLIGKKEINNINNLTIKDDLF